MTGLNPQTAEWERELKAILPLYGHRNWIVVADSAYPAQSKPGIETIVSHSDQVNVLRKAMDAIAACPHIRANIYTDLELEFVDDRDASGIAAYRATLKNLLAGSTATKLPHEEIITKLDRCAQVFRVLIIKTEMALPYTSVFFELDCGYWNAAAEERMRRSMSDAGK